MRLIDADKLILHLNDFMLQQSPVDAQDIESINVCAVIQECIKAVEEQPTAYDVDKLKNQIKELVEYPCGKDEKCIHAYDNFYEEYGGCEKCVAVRAEEIVKGGVMND